MVSWQMAVKSIGMHAGNCKYILGSTCNHQDEMKAHKNEWILYSVECCTRSMLYSVYYVLGICRIRSMLYLLYALVGAYCTWCMLYAVSTREHGMDSLRGIT
jgi:hypothetical protein